MEINRRRLRACQPCEYSAKHSPGLQLMDELELFDRPSHQPPRGVPAYCSNATELVYAWQTDLILTTLKLLCTI